MAGKTPNSKQVSSGPLKIRKETHLQCQLQLKCARGILSRPKMVHGQSKELLLSLPGEPISVLFSLRHKHSLKHSRRALHGNCTIEKLKHAAGPAEVTVGMWSSSYEDSRCQFWQTVIKKTMHTDEELRNIVQRTF